MNPYKNLIFFLPHFIKGGASFAILNLCSFLHKKKFNIHVICIGKCSLKKDLKGILNLGSGKSFSLQKIIKIISNKLKIPCKIIKYNKTDKIVSSNNLVRKIGFQIKNEENFNI